MQGSRAESQRHRIPGCQRNGSWRDGPRTGPRRGNAGENAGQHSLGPVAITTLDTVGVADVSLLCARRVPHALHVERLRRDSGASFGRRFVPSATTVQKEMERNRGVNDPGGARYTARASSRGVVHASVPLSDPVGVGNGGGRDARQESRGAIATLSTVVLRNHNDNLIVMSNVFDDVPIGDVTTTNDAAAQCTSPIARSSI